MKVAFRTDASAQIGTGHVMRCLSLAEALRERGAAVLFICRQLPGHRFKEIQKRGFEVISFSGSNHSDAEETAALLKSKGLPWDWLVVDHYDLGRKWESTVRPAAEWILVIDDLADRHHDCDVLLDQNFHLEPKTRYQKLVPNSCRLLAGPHFALLRKQFAEQRAHLRRRDYKVRRILILFGGVDAGGETLKALKSLEQLSLKGISCDIVVPHDHPKKSEIEKAANALHSAQVFFDVSEMATLMDSADLAIGAAGTATWERAVLGLPSLLISVASNQTPVAEAVHRYGAALYLGWHTEVTPELIAQSVKELMRTPERMREMSEHSLLLVDGKGVQRVISAMGLVA